jgi:aspartate-semialdehyde dehydrogenase
MRFHNVIHLKKTDTQGRNETSSRDSKILGDKTIAVTAAVRVPIVGGHSEAVNEFKNEFEVSDIQNLLHHTDGVVVQDNNDTYTYPMPMYAQGKDDVFVGRIRRDESQPNTLNMWIVADN